MELKILNQGYQISLIRKFVFQVLPKVDRELKKWLKEIRNFESDELAHQAMDSIKLKKFHCQGGGVFSLYPGCNTNRMIELIVALQTISDYLDNLCDRTTVKDEKTFRQLHLAFTESLDPGHEISDYYLLYPQKDDGEYLNKLVAVCKSCIRELPTYSKVKKFVLRFGELYSELQVYKHLPSNIREEKVQDWSRPYLEGLRGITGWEFAAATGSTLAIFMLFALASDNKCSEKDILSISNTYFPWICGLHILLDYFIDLEEDRQWGDLNFVSYYANSSECEIRLKLFIDQSMKAASKLQNKFFHKTVVQGLLALYLSDPKVVHEHKAIASRSLVISGGNMSYILWKMCNYLRKRNII